MAGIAYDLYTKQELRETIMKEFREKQDAYAPMYNE